MEGDDLKHHLPDWARWLAQDASGDWWAYEHEPNEGPRGWYENEVGRSRRLLRGRPPADWRRTLRRLKPTT